MTNEQGSKRHDQRRINRVRNLPSQRPEREEERMRTTTSAGIVLTILVSGLPAVAPAAGSAAPSSASTNIDDQQLSRSANQAAVNQMYGPLPLHFEANRGQTEPRVKFLTHGRGSTLFLT